MTSTITTDTSRPTLFVQEEESSNSISSADDDVIDETAVNTIPAAGSLPSEWEACLPKSIGLPAQVTKIRVVKVAILYNPKSGARKGEKLAQKACRIFSLHNIATELIPLQRKGHAKELCRTMNVDNYSVICILGGDGTFHESINGYMTREDDARLRVPLAVLPGGTGNSFALEIQGNAKLETSIGHIIRGVCCNIDVCRVYFPSNETCIYSFNSIHWGMASNVNVMAEQLRWMGKAVRYTTASLMEVFKGEKTLAIVEMVEKDGTRITLKDEFSLCIANNIQTAAKGMKLAPDAKLNDGLIDVILVNSKKTTDLAQLFPKFYDGTHVNLKFVEYKQVKNFCIIPLEKDDPEYADGFYDPATAEEILDIDGELSGIAPFQCTVLPSSLKVIV